MKIGIAGGIGSGKSYVSQKIRDFGYEVYDCDNAAKRLINTSPDIRLKNVPSGISRARLETTQVDYLIESTEE